MSKFCVKIQDKQTPHKRVHLRTLQVLWLVVVGLFALSACKEELPRRPIAIPLSPQSLQGKPGRMMSATNTPQVAPGKGIAGVIWQVPKLWQRGQKRPMRAATYWIPGAYGKRGECSVFHFGPQGGSDQANIDRWRKQFTYPTPSAAASQVKVETKYANGLKMTFVTIRGTFLSSVRPMSPQKIAKPGYAMLGAIIKAPGGPVFFKCVGPEATLTKATSTFRTMIYSARKGS